MEKAKAPKDPPLSTEKIYLAARRPANLMDTDPPLLVQPLAVEDLPPFQYCMHKASEQMCYPLNEDELIVNLKTGYDVKRVFIYYGDPFEAGILGGKEQWAGKKEEICFI